MEDDHVDRPGVEVRQRMKLTGTNRSIGLIVLVAYAHQTKFDDAIFCPHAVAIGRSLRCGRRAPQGATRSALAAFGRGGRQKTCSKKRGESLTSFSQLLPPGAKLALCRPGGSGGVAAPVPIPNTAVKRPSADGTSS